MTETGARLRPISTLGQFVAHRVSRLQETFLAGSPAAQADLAKLRRAAGKRPGDIADVWELTLGGVPRYGHLVSDEPTPNEWACHIALTMYALHQRSRSARMHRPGVGLGAAVRGLRAGDDSAVTRRFALVASASTLPEVAYHSRALVGSLRDADIGLDYGLLADQLVRLQMPDRGAGVRLAWGRDFYRDPAPTTDRLAQTTPPTALTAPTENKGDPT